MFSLRFAQAITHLLKKFTDSKQEANKKKDTADKEGEPVRT